jgi:hypothetical protein
MINHVVGGRQKASISVVFVGVGIELKRLLRCSDIVPKSNLVSFFLSSVYDEGEGYPICM